MRSPSATARRPASSSRLMFQEAEMALEAKAQLRANLLRYCQQDTWGLVKLLERLRLLSRG